jgi:puromycin-sensitive aminopeptidase
VNDVDPHRLPRTARPEHYDLVLEPDLDAGTFAGTATVRVEVLEPTSELVCNALDLVIDEAWLASGDERVPLEVQLDAGTERATLRSASELPRGTTTLVVVFRGELNDKLRGFYRSRFRTADGAEHVLATTQFEATDARRAFPCWDEPEHKATFGITLVVADGLVAVSNARPIQETDEGDGRRRIRFADTMRMSTYLVAFVIGALEITEAVDVDGVPLRVVHTPGQGHLTAFALETGEFALRYFTDYYGIPYPGDKLDLVAIPDFAFGAMENLGCVTFRETLLLVDPDAVTQPELQRVADVINHELAHMWFGDLVTMRWWNGIWLNEAFATFMEMKCTDAFRPAWQRWTDFGLSRSAAMDVDSLAATRPIEYEVRSPADAEGMFDLLTYEKGAAVVRMLEQYLGEERFREGIRRYLLAHSYANTETHDLWDALEAATGEPVRAMMETWIFQGGHPLVRVAAGADPSAPVTVAQERFRYLPGTEPASEPVTDPPARWIVPLRIRTDAGEVRALLDGDETTVELLPGALHTANAAGTGFYRVRFDDEHLARLASGGPRGLSPIERYGLIDDTWASVLAGDVTAAQFTAVLRGFRAEDDLSVWQRIIGTLDSLGRAIDPADPATAAAFRRWVLALVANAQTRLGPQRSAQESERSGQLRGALFTVAGTIGQDEQTVQRARSLVAEPAGDPALDAAAIDIVAAHGTAEDHRRYVARMASAASPQQSERYRGALADFPGRAELLATLELLLDGTIRTQDIPFVVRRSLRNRVQGPTAWAFLQERWDDLTGAIPSNLVARMLEGIPALAEPALAAEVEAFLDAHPVPQGRAVVAQHRERLHVQLAFRARERPRLPDVFA